MHFYLYSPPRIKAAFLGALERSSVADINSHGGAARAASSSVASLRLRERGRRTRQG